MTYICLKNRGKVGIGKIEALAGVRYIEDESSVFLVGGKTLRPGYRFKTTE